MIKSIPTKQKKRGISLTISKVPVVEKIFFIQNLALMIRTGFSLADALTTLQQQTKNKLFQNIVNEVHQDVLKGENFSTALAKHPKTFDELFVSMIAAGEITGNLELTLQQLTIQLKKAYTLRKKIIQAMIYPSVILVAMIIMGTFMFIFVVPKILDLYSGGNYTLPVPTQIILTLSNFLQQNGVVVIIGIILFTILFVTIWRTEKGHYMMNKIILHLPVVKGIIKKINVAKISRLLNSLITTDISIVKGFDIIARTIGNRVFRKFLEHCSEILVRGTSINSLILERPDLFDPVIGQMIKVGEASGSLDEITNELALFYETEVDDVMANLTIIIEPVLMIVIGVAVGFLAVAIIMPIYGLVDQI